MEQVCLVRTLSMQVEECECRVEVFRRPNGTHFARTVFSPHDVIINESETCEEAVRRHCDLLPLAVHSRLLVRKRA